MEIFDRQQFGLPVFQPLGPVGVLAFWAVAVPAGVVSVLDSFAVVAFFGMATEDCRAANLDGSHDAQLLEGKLVGIPVSRAVLSKDVGHFKSGPWHPDYFRDFFSGFFSSLWAGLSSGLLVAATTCEATRTYRDVVSMRLWPSNA
jgi:hypothetical protein